MEFDVFTFQKKKAEETVQSCVIDPDEDRESGNRSALPFS
jgi:hypothetical protein